MAVGAHGGGAGGGGTHCDANMGAYGGGGLYHGGGAGGSLHSLVHTLRDQLGSHCAEPTPGAATVTAAIGTNMTAAPAAKQRTNLYRRRPPEGPVPKLGVLQLMPPTQFRFVVSATFALSSSSYRGSAVESS
jgi:hypothetical protein